MLVRPLTHTTVTSSDLFVAQLAESISLPTILAIIPNDFLNVIGAYDLFLLHFTTVENNVLFSHSSNGFYSPARDHWIMRENLVVIKVSSNF